MSRLTAQRREFYGLCLGVLLIANLASGAAVVVARASGPAAAGTTVPGFADDPVVGLADRPAEPDGSAPDAGSTDCGQGSATAQAVLDRTGTGYELRATVANNSNRTVELDRLVVQATYGDVVRSFTAAATGHWIAAGVAETGFGLPESASLTQPTSFAVTDFAFHTAGRPGCAAR
ncbi:MAG TPA: hypothetical protein VGR20_03350 [Acidimicrobiia bacterium]|jgi:hypothetical protein|nr:hypothetical protein [Acidimicrobiia bacterium]